jgi:DNA replication initiation complex subunit (GINS family)
LEGIPVNIYLDGEGKKIADHLTPEERKFLFSLTDARIKALQTKALKRLSMTDEEKAQYKALHALQNDPNLRDTAALLATLGNWKKEQHDET